MKIARFKFIIILSIVSGITAKHSLAALDSKKLIEIKEKVLELEEKLLESKDKNAKAKETFKKIEALILLQKQERELTKNRSFELDKTIKDLELKRSQMNERIQKERIDLRQSLIEIHKRLNAIPSSPDEILPLELDQPRLHLLQKLAASSIREIETIRADLSDAESLESRIAEERSQADMLIHELSESESLLELNRKLQFDLIKQTHSQRLSQLERYQSMKASESQVTNMIKDFNTRMEIQDNIQKERHLSALLQSPFGRQKGLLAFPISSSEILSHFGKSFDEKSGLSLFKKGIELKADKNSPVSAVFEGKVAFAGELPNYGKMVIIDHGGHFYSICGNLGSIDIKTGDELSKGSKIGVTELTGKPLYFEIRARNIPVDPLQWISKTLSMK